MELKVIPFDIINMIANNVKKKTLNESSSVCKLQYETKLALMNIRDQNNLKSISDTVDMLICGLALQQYKDDNRSEEVLLAGRRDFSKGGIARPVIVNNKEFYSVSSCAKFYKKSSVTIINRIKDLGSKYRNWNYKDEDVSIKYDKRRVE